MKYPDASGVSGLAGPEFRYNSDSGRPWTLTRAGVSLIKRSPSHPPAAPSPSKDGVEKCKPSKEAPNQPMSGLRPQPAARTHNFVGAGQFKEGLERPKSRVQPLKGQVSENSGKSAGQAGLRKDNQ